MPTETLTATVTAAAHPLLPLDFAVRECIPDALVRFAAMLGKYTGAPYLAAAAQLRGLREINSQGTVARACDTLREMSDLRQPCIAFAVSACDNTFSSGGRLDSVMCDEAIVAARELAPEEGE